MARRLSAQALRYILAGLALNGLYWLLAVALEAWGPWGKTAASGLSYAGTSMLAYFFHRHFTFQSSSRVGPEAFRFAVATAVGLALAILLPRLLPGTSALAYGCVCIAAPVVNFLVYRTLVYSTSSVR